jgi:hypothetical protein
LTRYDESDNPGPFEFQRMELEENFLLSREEIQGVISLGVSDRVQRLLWLVEQTFYDARGNTKVARIIPRADRVQFGGIEGE